MVSAALAGLCLVQASVLSGCSEKNEEPTGGDRFSGTYGIWGSRTSGR